MKTYAIGDIHGGLKALIQVLGLLKPTPQDKLIFLGDYVDGWSESFEVIEYLIDLQHKHNCVFIKGNHDVFCEDWLKDKTENDTWLHHGGIATQKSYQNATSSQKQNHLDFFGKMLNYYIDNQNRLFIHAGFSSMHGPEKEMYISNCSWDRTL